MLHTPLNGVLFRIPIMNQPVSSVPFRPGICLWIVKPGTVVLPLRCGGL